MTTQAHCQGSAFCGPALTGYKPVGRRAASRLHHFSHEIPSPTHHPHISSAVPPTLYLTSPHLASPHQTHRLHFNPSPHSHPIHDDKMTFPPPKRDARASFLMFGYSQHLIQKKNETFHDLFPFSGTQLRKNRDLLHA
ncbi:hypothetical protein K461DRAFT_3435 [Myriangium duriaei CBS 260.36]|uniref:Uncharacterized protein n=1 Tax=Myriangium duriaei CBS 260.36 TaxID=1168546 RepID=A0A9P4MKV4_9PEZI|nr:hypothetical protein K461DRAFT_3435 [Myriangium duriaei CBS 260.36]